MDFEHELEQQRSTTYFREGSIFFLLYLLRTHQSNLFVCCLFVPDMALGRPRGAPVVEFKFVTHSHLHLPDESPQRSLTCFLHFSSSLFFPVPAKIQSSSPSFFNRASRAPLNAKQVATSVAKSKSAPKIKKRVFCVPRVYFNIRCIVLKWPPC